MKETSVGAMLAKLTSQREPEIIGGGKMTEWKPLDDNAPKNRMILLGGRDEEGNQWVNSGYWETYEMWPNNVRPDPEWSWDVWFAPKWWMELPELPK